MRREYVAICTDCGDTIRSGASALHCPKCGAQFDLDIPVEDDTPDAPGVAK